MNKSEFVESLSVKYFHYRASDVEKAVQLILQKMTEAMGQGGRVEIRSFGSFSVRERKPRIGRNPRTGEAVALPSKRVPHFKPGKVLRERVNHLPGQSA